jgi:hypothetical protein
MLSQRKILLQILAQAVQAGATIVASHFYNPIGQENGMDYSAMTRRDEARFKGAMEDDGNPAGTDGRRQLSSFGDQLGHRDQDEMLKAADSDNCGG